MKKPGSKKRRVATVLLIVFLIPLWILLTMQRATNRIIREIRRAITTADYYVRAEEYENGKENYGRELQENITYIPYEYNDPETNIMQHFSLRSAISPLPEGVSFEDLEFEVKVTRTFAWHNFYEGRIWLRYTAVVYLPDGEILTGSWDIPVYMDIQRQNGKWVALEIWERP